MGLRRMLALAIATAGCTKPNPAFDQDGGGTRGDDETGKDTHDESVTSVDSTDNGSVEGTGIASSNSSEATTSASDEIGGTDEGESGAVECPGTTDFDWGVDILQSDIPAKVDCGVEFEASGLVIAAEDGLLVIQDCDGCDCSTSFGEYEFHAEGLLPADRFIIGECAGISIDWSADDCHPIGFVAFAGETPGRAQVVAGQDVETMPTGVGGGVIAVVRDQTCDCPDCCPETGTLALVFAGTPIAEGEAKDVEDLVGNTDSFLVTVHEAHAHEDCTRSLSWSAILNL